MKKECSFIDVFTDTPYCGNQLAVFPDADDLSTKQMQSLANEINYSETVFILKSTDVDADYQIRIFTPKQEMPFAGHPTLGAAYSIASIFKLPQKDTTVLKLQTSVGVIPLTLEEDKIWMRQKKPDFIRTYTDLKEIADLVCLHPEDISPSWPIEEVSTGMRMLLVPIHSLSAISRAAGNAHNLEAFRQKTGCFAPYLFTIETVDQKAAIHTRFFAPHAGIIEDPATGSAAGPLTAYLLKHKVFGSNFDILNEQGLEMKRDSKILMRGSLLNGNYSINIGGLCVLVGTAEFRL